MSRKIFVCMIVSVVLGFAGSSFAGSGASLVMFDQGHKQRFLIEDAGELQLSGLADAIRGTGSLVASTKNKLSDETLKGVSALVISGPFEALQPEEVDAVMRFIDGGGRLALMLHIGQPLAGLLARLDLDYSNAVLHERSNVIDADTNFRITGLSAAPLFDGLSGFSAYGCWALNPGKNAAAAAQTSAQAWVDLNGDKTLSKGDIVGEFSVVVTGKSGAGSYAVFGDDAIFQNRYLDKDNLLLAGNLAGWLAGK